MRPVDDTPRPRRRGRPLTVLAAVTGLLAASAMVWNASNAAFTDTTTNGTNSFGAGTVVLSDNDSTAALFNVGTMAPGAVGEACITVTYDGTLTSDVRLYASGLTAQNSIDDEITLTVEYGTFSSAPTYPACTNFTPTSTVYTGTLAAFGAKTNWAAGVASWGPTGSGQTRSFKFSYELSATAPNTVQGSSAQLSFVWEAQSA